MKYLRDKGYYCIRAYASKGLFDIIAVPPPISDWMIDGIKTQTTLLIQAKYNGNVPLKEMDKLVENEFSWWGKILIAYNDKKQKNKLSFFDLKGEDVII